MTYVEALQATLAGEHAAVYVLGYLGGRADPLEPGTLPDALGEAFAAHRRRRDDLIAAIEREGVEPVSAEPGYQVDDVPSRPARIRAQALAVERACGDLYGYLVAHTDAGSRDWAITALLDSAERELAFGGEPRAFPGR